MLFARAIGEDHPAYQAAMIGHGDGTPAPPTFVQAAAQFDPDYPLRPSPGQSGVGSCRESGFAPEGGGGLHAEQHFTYHQVVRAGMVLSATTRDGNRWEKEGKRGGRLLFAETVTEYRDENGTLVMTA